MINIIGFKVSSVIIILFILVGCSSTKIRPIEASSKETSAVVASKTTESLRSSMNSEERFYSNLKSLDFPVRSNIRQQNAAVAFTIGTMKTEIKFHHIMNDEFPDSIAEIVDNGLLLFWPRNPLDGKPLITTVNHDFTLDRSDFGLFQYEILNESKMVFRQIYLDKDIYDSSGDEVWKEITSELKTESEENYLDNKPIIGGQQLFHDIEDSQIRDLYAKVGLLFHYIFENQTRYYSYLEKLPVTFEDILFNNRYVIEESFNELAQLIIDTDAEFVWGFDRDKKISYFLLEIDGEKYIEKTSVYGEIEGSLSKTGFHPHGTSPAVKDLNITPILTDENIGVLEIPSEYLISKDNIPFM